MKTLYVALRNPDTRSWSPVARLTKEDTGYRFVYTRGANDIPGFNGFDLLDDLFASYRSEELFPIFANRVLSRKRPEFTKYSEWLGLDPSVSDLLYELALTGGTRATDKVELFAAPAPSSTYSIKFFTRGLNYLSQDNQDRVNELEIGQRLYLMKDVQNNSDSLAVLLRTDDPISIVGYLPRYYTSDVCKLLEKENDGAILTTIQKVNFDAPIQYRVLCNMEAPWPNSFKPFSSSEYIPINQSENNPSEYKLMNRNLN